jgi:hypothetical protein
MARDERQRNKTTAAKAYSDDDSAKTPAPTQTSGRPSGMQSASGAGFQPLPSTAEIRQTCRRELGSRMDAARQGKLESKQAEMCVLWERQMDSAYEALVDRSLALQNEVCPKIYPLGLDSAKVAADPVLGPKVQELKALANQFRQRMDDTTKELIRITTQKGPAAEHDPQFIDCRFRALRMQIDFNRISGNCTRGF